MFALRRFVQQHAAAPAVPSAARCLSTATTNNGLLKYLVVDGYSKEGRENLAAGGCSVASDLYSRMLKRWSPGADATIDIAFVADPDCAIPEPANYDGVCFTGSSLCIMDDTPEVRQQIEFAQHVFASNVPCYGSCWAMQLAAVAAGGVCAANPRGREMGFARRITLTADGRAHPMYEGKPVSFDAFASHNDEVTHISTGTLLLSSNDFCLMQAIAVQGDTFWGVQYHPEYNIHELARLTATRAEVLIQRGFFKDRKAVDTYVADLSALVEDPSRTDIAWRYGIDATVLDASVRERETINWINKVVVPRRQAKAAVGGA